MISAAIFSANISHPSDGKVCYILYPRTQTVEFAEFVFVGVFELMQYHAVLKRELFKELIKSV